MIYQPQKGMSLRQAINEATRLAQKTCSTLGMKYEGTTINIYPESHVRDLEDKYFLKRLNDQILKGK